jgi:integrase/recombinase XerD
MLEDYCVKPSTIDRVRSSWLAPQIESYLTWLQAHGYSRLVVYRRLPLLFHFAEFAQKKGCIDVSSCKVYIKQFVSQWLEQHGARTKTAVAVREHAIDADCGVRQMLQLACKEPVARNRRRGPFPFESAVPGFAEYLRSERGFAESTIRNYRRHLSEFAQYLSQTGVTSFSQLSPPVLGFRREAHAENGSAHALRSLLSFASVVAVLSPRRNHESGSQRSRGNSADISPRRCATFHHLG